LFGGLASLDVPHRGSVFVRESQVPVSGTGDPFSRPELLPRRKRDVPLLVESDAGTSPVRGLPSLHVPQRRLASPGMETNQQAHEPDQPGVPTCDGCFSSAQPLTTQPCVAQWGPLPSRSADFAPRTHRGPSTQFWVDESEVSWRSRRWSPDKSSKAAGQVFEPDRPHKSLHVLGRRLKTKVLVIGLEVTRRPDMPSKPVWGRELPGGFDSRPPPLLKEVSDQPLRVEAGERRPRKGARSDLRRPRLLHKSFNFASCGTGQVFRPPAGSRPTAAGQPELKASDAHHTRSDTRGRNASSSPWATFRSPEAVGVA
jgi:hypothetical protein